MKDAALLNTGHMQCQTCLAEHKERIIGNAQQELRSCLSQVQQHIEQGVARVDAPMGTDVQDDVAWLAVAGKHKHFAISMQGSWHCIPHRQLLTFNHTDQSNNAICAEIPTHEQRYLESQTKSVPPGCTEDQRQM